MTGDLSGSIPDDLEAHESSEPISSEQLKKFLTLYETQTTLQAQQDTAVRDLVTALREEFVALQEKADSLQALQEELRVEGGATAAAAPWRKLTAAQAALIGSILLALTTVFTTVFSHDAKEEPTNCPVVFLQYQAQADREHHSLHLPATNKDQAACDVNANVIPTKAP